MESLFSLFGGSGVGGAANAGDGMNAATGGLNYLGNGAQVNPSTIGTPGNGNPNFGPSQGGPNFSQFAGNMATQLQQKSAVGGQGGGGAGAGQGGMNASGGYMGGHF